ncbi:hypothetical protein FA15DRAFT_667608 [Coprinopsis marcescibilis]|uniref:Uncharacterized protein n=1 Tax=Coprinopsis marcescibilis TaxID=230819 RepID=A0A5C3L0V1_COPMA|nr:hypothetical protein FA15DRAFT_667608 [Coprinopsis marcescibilis]
MSSCSDDCICCCLPVIVCWACVYYTFAGVRSACKYCYKKCRPRSSSTDDEPEQREKEDPSAPPHMDSTRKSSNFNYYAATQNEMRSSRPPSPVTSLQMPPPAHSSPTIRTQPLPIGDMTLNSHPRSNNGEGSSRHASPTFGLRSTDLYRPHHQSSLSISHPPDRMPDGSEHHHQSESISHLSHADYRHDGPISYPNVRLQKGDLESEAEEEDSDYDDESIRVEARIDFESRRQSSEASSIRPQSRRIQVGKRRREPPSVWNPVTHEHFTAMAPSLTL